jgi:uracil-DNA glycosylase
MIVDLTDFNLPKCWEKILTQEFNKDYFKSLNDFLVNEQKAGKTIFPQMLDVFNCLFFTPFSKVKVVILGQDPYHGDNQANGLAFSVKKNIAVPPSLKNIYKEISSDIGHDVPLHGDLSEWARQGVLLMNSTLTVEEKKPASHQGRGWEVFTDRIISYLSVHKENVVFILWGNKSIEKKSMIDESKHLVITSPHPSPLSAYRGFVGSKQFSACNNYLEQSKISSIDWSIK